MLALLVLRVHYGPDIGLALTEAAVFVAPTHESV